MLKKFKQLNNFFHPLKTDLGFEFTPFVATINDQIFQVMEATEEDIPTLMTFETEVYHGVATWSIGKFRSELRKDNSLYLLVYHESQLVALIGARFYLKETHITNLSVVPDFQNQGIGTWLMELMIDLARQKSSELVSLEVRIDNEKAKQLYKKLGFEALFIRKNYYRDLQLDAINMVLWLKPHRLKKREK